MRTMRNPPGRTLLVVLAASLLAGTALTLAAEPATEWHKKALELNALTGDNTLKGMIDLLKKDPASARKLLAAAGELAKDRKKQPFNANATYVLAQVAEDLKNRTLGQTFYEIQVEQTAKLEDGQRLAMAYWGLINLLIEDGKFADSQKVYQKFLETDPGEGGEDQGPEGLSRQEIFALYKARVERMMVLALAGQGQIDEALKIVEGKLKKATNPYPYMDVKARVLRQAGKLDQAAQSYEDMIDRARRDPNLNDRQKNIVIDDSRYALSGVYVDLNQIDKAAGQLKALLEKDPENPSFNNDLGFIWADHDMNLAESEKLIRKAIENDRKQRQKDNPNQKPEEIKDNPSYLDSLGWVLYKQKKYKEAKPHLQAAVAQEEGQSSEIYDHLADCLLANGEKTEAIATFKKAIETSGSSRRDQKRKAEIEKKLKQALAD